MAIWKKSLACLLAAAATVSMTLSSLTLTAFAADGDLLATWTARNNRTETDAYKALVPDSVEGRGLADLRSDMGDLAGLRYEGDDIVITPDDLVNVSNPIFGCEINLLPAATYTAKAIVKLKDDPSVLDGDFPMIALSPYLRIGNPKRDGSGFRPEYLTLSSLRAKAAKAGEDGYFNLWCAITPEKGNYTAGGEVISIETRISGPNDSADVERVIDERLGGSSLELYVKEISIYEGNVVPVGEQDGWASDGFYYENGEKIVSRLVPAPSGVGYCFLDEAGVAVKSRMQTVGADTYYFNEQGVSVGGRFVTVDGKEYYFGSNYKKATAAQLVTSAGSIYAVNANGEKIKNNWYQNQYFGADGRRATNQIVANTYGVDASGEMIKNKIAELGNTLYAFGADGKLLNGNRVKVGSRYTCAKNGVVKPNTKTGKYITGANGYLIQNGVKKIKKTTYAVKNYKVVSGNKVVKIGKKSYAVKKGKVVTGKKQIVKIGKKSYAVKKSGQLYGKQKKLKIGKKTYKVAANGVAKRIKKK